MSPPSVVASMVGAMKTPVAVSVLKSGSFCAAASMVKISASRPLGSTRPLRPGLTLGSTGAGSALGGLGAAMLLWMSFAVLTAAVLAYVLKPLWAALPEVRTAGDPAAVYRDQLKEIDGELERGVIGTEQQQIEIV